VPAEAPQKTRKSRQLASKIQPLDGINRAIIDHLEANARISFSDLAAAVHMSVPAVIERVRRLEQDRVIRGYHAEIDRAQLGAAMHVFIRLHATSANERLFLKQLNAGAWPEVQRCLAIAGEFSFLIEAHLDSVERMESLLASFAAYGSTTTNVVLTTHRA
jgi:Lrp/AsnC family transcriptional regulator, leucine-responsive regulatory protein